MVITPVFNTLESPGDVYNLQVSLADNYVINEIPVLEAWVHLGDLALVWYYKHGVSDGKVMVGPQSREPQSILIDISNSMPADDTVPETTWLDPTLSFKLPKRMIMSEQGMLHSVWVVLV